MRNAVAQFDDDFEVREPARKKNARPAAAGGKGKKKGATRRWLTLVTDAKRISRYAAIGMSATIAVGILVNALVLQKSRHPAPLFGSSVAIGDKAKHEAVAAHRVRPAEVTEAAAPAPAKPSQDDAAVEAPISRKAAEPEKAATPVAPPARPHQDEIARLLAGTAPAAVEKPDARTVLSAQKALVKIGFVLKPNGVLGPQTRKAIEIFQKDHKLPVDGELSHRVIRALATESKLKIDR